MELDHCQKYYPGQITNDSDLIDDSDRNLKGTGSAPGYEATVYDKYLKADVKERYHYKIVNPDIWDFLFSRYGGSEIKRYYM